MRHEGFSLQFQYAILHIPFFQRSNIRCLPLSPCSSHRSRSPPLLEGVGGGDYSSCNASMGFIPAARLAGTYPAITPATIKITTAATAMVKLAEGL